MKKLLYAGIVGPLLFIVVFLVEGLTRPGYSAWRHYVSQLATGDGGWVQTVNFLMCGTLVIAFAVGLRATLKGSRGSIGGPLLIGLFGVALLVAGTFVTDPALGYPVGAAQAHTIHGMIHGLAGLAAFTLLPAAAFVMAWHFAAQPESRRWTRYSVGVGLLIVGCFIASTGVSVLDERGIWVNAPTGFIQRIAIITGWTWMAMVAWHQLRALPALPARRRREIAPRIPAGAE
jgi:hypothetical membrane protein